MMAKRGQALNRKDAFYLLVFVWSFVGIAVKQVSAPMVVTGAWVAAAAMLILAGYSLLRRQPA
jgi:CHASE2 domain-containing sensor protein